MFYVNSELKLESTIDMSHMILFDFRYVKLEIIKLKLIKVPLDWRNVGYEIFHVINY